MPGAWIGLMVLACGLAGGCTQTGGDAARAEKKGAQADCSTLAGSPIEGNALAPRLQIDGVDPAAAVAACNAAVSERPDDALSWRRLHRAHYAAALAEQGETHWPAAVHALKKAAALGDIRSRVDLSIINFDQSHNPQQVLDEGGRLAAELDGRNLTTGSDLFAAAILKSALADIESQRIEEAQGMTAAFTYKQAREAEAKTLFLGAIAASGGIAVYKEIGEVDRLGHCRRYGLICSWHRNAEYTKNDPDLFIAIGRDSIMEGYQRVNRAYAAVKAGRIASTVALQAGQSWADQARAYAGWAEGAGNVGHGKAAEGIRAAAGQLNDYAGQQFDLAELEAQKHREQAFVALAALLVASASTSDGSTQAQPSERSYLDIQREAECHTAQSALAWSPELKGEMANYYRAAALTC